MVLKRSESLINVITKNPAKGNNPRASMPAIQLIAEGNLDLGYTTTLGKLSVLLGLNYFKYGNPVDLNGDNFTDVTLQDRISVFNKWSLKRKDNHIANIAFRYVYEDRWGGEMQWTPSFRGGDEIYGESIWTNRCELIGNYQLPVKETIIYRGSASKHYQNSVYGNVSYM